MDGLILPVRNTAVDLGGPKAVENDLREQLRVFHGSAPSCHPCPLWDLQSGHGQDVGLLLAAHAGSLYGLENLRSELVEPLVSSMPVGREPTSLESPDPDRPVLDHQLSPGHGLVHVLVDLGPRSLLKYYQNPH